MPTGGDRRLATFLFLDVVGSTALAAELGDRRWREVLHRFRRSVHERVKAHGGTEQDWAFETPEGISAGSIVPTPDGAHVWVASCGCPIEE
jgi:class 3 adenylate cyclase